MISNFIPHFSGHGGQKFSPKQFYGKRTVPTRIHTNSSVIWSTELLLYLILAFLAYHGANGLKCSRSANFTHSVVSWPILSLLWSDPTMSNPVNTECIQHVIMMSKRHFDVIITYLLRCVFSPINSAQEMRTLLMLTPKYSERSRSIPQLLMIWLLTSPGHHAIIHTG